MSWSVSYIGKPEKIVEALNQHTSSLSGQSLEEYQDALPYLIGIVQQNLNTDYDLILNFSAGGSGYRADGVYKHKSCTIKLEQMYGKILI